jgi:N-acyl-D-amino-acid deacylase
VISNAALTATGVPNPAAYGAFPQLLGRYARDHPVFPVEEAVRRATSLPADRMGLRDVGRIAEGYRADLVIFDPATVAETG